MTTKEVAISGVYQIVNKITGERYVGSSKDVKRRWRQHKRPSVWRKQPNSPLYLDMQKYGVENFRFQILASIMPECLKQAEQNFIEFLKPEYNNNRAKGWDMERRKEAAKKYQKTEKGKQVRRKSVKKYFQTEKGKAALRKANRKAVRKYYNQLCCYNGETLTLNALASRFYKAGIPHATLEAKKYLLVQR